MNKVPPSSIPSEQALLGSLLLDDKVRHTIIGKLSKEDFYDPRNERVFDAIENLYAKSKPVDISTVSTYLREKDLLTIIGGVGYLGDLCLEPVTAADAEYHLDIVKEKSTRRALLRTSGEMLDSLYKNDEDVEDIIDKAEGDLIKIGQSTTQSALTAVGKDVQGTEERLKLLATQGVLRGISTGFKSLDNMLSGFQKSDLVIVGARPSLGKTSLALDFAKNAALTGKKVGVFSLEMSRDQVVDRLMSSLSNVSLWKLRTGRVNDGDMVKVKKALATMQDLPLFIEDSASPTTLQIRSMCRKMQVEHGLDLVVIDYLQLILPKHRTDSMVTQVTEISRALKGLARELGVPVIALSQLSRSVDQREDKTPRLHDLRESGSIEQDADVVLLISRNRYPNQGETNVAQVIIAKHRNGPVGNVDLAFDQETASFRELDFVHVAPEPGTYFSPQASFDSVQ